MYGKRIRLGFGIGLCAIAAIALSHVGFDTAVPTVMILAAFGAGYLSSRTFFRLVADGMTVHFGPVALYGYLARRLDLSARRILTFIGASLHARGVGLRAMLPIGGSLGASSGYARLMIG